MRRGSPDFGRFQIQDSTFRLLAATPMAICGGGRQLLGETHCVTFYRHASVIVKYIVIRTHGDGFRAWYRRLGSRGPCLGGGAAP